MRMQTKGGRARKRETRGRVCSLGCFYVGREESESERERERERGK